MSGETPKLHRLVGDGDRVACGARHIYAMRYERHAAEWTTRNPEVKPCARCWPSRTPRAPRSSSPSPASPTPTT